MRYAENYSKCAVLKFRFKTGVCTFRIFGRSLLAVSTGACATCCEGCTPFGSYFDQSSLSEINISQHLLKTPYTRD